MGVNLIRIVATSILAIALGTAFGYGLNVVKPHESYRLRLDYEHRTRVPKPAATTEAGHLDLRFDYGLPESR